jgi:PadR family transcriptional regulator, regulatory protein AphA
MGLLYYMLYLLCSLGERGMSLEAAIMGFLAAEPRSGYDLKTRCFDRQAAAFWTADQAQIYRTLDRLQSTRLVTCTRKRQVGRPDRKVYRLTEAGARSFECWIAAPSPLTPPRDPFLLQVFFSAALTDDEIVESLSRERGAHQARLEDLRLEVGSLAEDATLPQRTRLLREAAFDGAIARERASIDWLDDTIDAIEGGRLPAATRSAAPGDCQPMAGSDSA